MAADIHAATSEIGILGVLILIMRSYSMGAGTYTGIEAISNGLPILRKPRFDSVPSYDAIHEHLAGGYGIWVSDSLYPL